jgi:hypothetical protein
LAYPTPPPRDLEFGHCLCGCGQPTTRGRTRRDRGNRSQADPAWFVRGHHHRVAPDGELIRTPDTAWCGACRTRKPHAEFSTRTVKTRAGYLAKPHDYCVTCRRVRERRWHGRRATKWVERYRTDEEFRRQILERRRAHHAAHRERLLAEQREARRRARATPAALERDRERRRRYDAAYRERQRRDRAEREREDQLMRTDPLCLRPGDPEAMRLLELAFARAEGVVDAVERALGMASSNLKHYRRGARGLTLDHLDRLHLLLGEPMLDTWDLRRRSEWRVALAAEEAEEEAA